MSLQLSIFHHRDQVRPLKLPNPEMRYIRFHVTGNRYAVKWQPSTAILAASIRFGDGHLDGLFGRPKSLCCRAIGLGANA